MAASRSPKRKTKTRRPASKSSASEAKPANRNMAEVSDIKKILMDHVPPQDRTQFHEQDFKAIADGFWNFARERKNGQVKIKIFNPTLKKDGFYSRHTVIMIVNDDMPFLVDSTTTELNRMGLGIHLVVHPILNVTRNDKSFLTDFSVRNGAHDRSDKKSWMYIEIDETPEKERLDEITENLKNVLKNVRLAVQDWQAMRQLVMKTITELPRNDVAGLPDGDREETAELLAWLEADNFTFLGARDYRVSGTGNKARLETITDRGLGILRDPVSVMFFSEEGEGSQPANIAHFLKRKELTLITKTHRRSVVHRATPMDAILIKQFDDKGQVVGERLFVGLFTSSATNLSPKATPIIRNKIAYVNDKAGLDPRSHDGKAMDHILQTYPRDELFQTSAEELFQTASGILQLQERQRLALFVRLDTFSRYVSCLIFCPRERWSTKMRKAFEAILMRHFGGVTVDATVKITGDALSQIHFVIRTAKAVIPHFDSASIERELDEASRGWSGRLKEQLIVAFGENQGLRLADKYAEAFPEAYCENASVEAAIKDIAFIEDVLNDGKLSVSLYREAGADDRQIGLVWFNAGKALSLSEILPLMDNMGMRTNAMLGPFRISPKGAKSDVWVHDCTGTTTGAVKDISVIREKFEEGIISAWTGAIEADGYNQLILLASLSAREVVVLRTIGKYLRQARLPYSESTIISTLVNHAATAQALVQLFITRHDPANSKDRMRACAVLEKQILESLRDVKLADEDRILRRYLNVIQHSLRTNYFQTDAQEQPKTYLSIKLDSGKLDDLPLPRPHVEIFVYSPRTEAVHLRGGKVARGGIRWSDRRDDFRTEVLSLMKAQQVKNTVIVPVGSKGGFVVKNPHPDNMGKEGIACYQIMMRGLLDITDNMKGEKIVPPKDVVRHDGDDPYLVVAADKGTAKFSDIANAISLDYGFWLGDAFASGGSAGYDHKDMGITARGAWEAVKRHFREMGKNIQKEPFTVVGVGDMSGDVFGNGMLLSKAIRLVGAFNHKHIFLDPHPDTAASFAERKRLFEQAGSQWSDYDKKAISKGGGVFNRNSKTIALSKEAKALLGLSHDECSPDEIIKALLKADVELLYFGGIGTYVKAEKETDADAGDRTNDAVRINAEDIRAKVLGEGANLGMTQRARIAYAQRGGRLNTDAIDNSAGVDTSDHEVNIKILLDPFMRSGKLSLEARNKLLARMTDDVAYLVLRDNYLQTLALSMAETRAAELLPLHGRLMHKLERKGLLNRKIEFLPDDEEIQERIRSSRGLTRPELAVLMAYAKIDLYEEILNSNLPDDKGLESDLFRYFPKELHTSFKDGVLQHRLRREIIATFTTNSIINRGGLHIVQMLQEKTGRSAAEVARAYTMLRDVFSLRDLWKDIEKLDNNVPDATLVEIYTRIGKMIERATPWYLSNIDLKNVGAATKRHKEAVESIATWMRKGNDEFLKREKNKQRWQDYTQAGVPDDIIRRTLYLQALADVPEIVGLADHAGASMEMVAELFYGLEKQLQLPLLRAQARSLLPENKWQQEAADHMVDDLYRVQSRLTRLLLGGMTGKSTKKAATKQIGKTGLAIKEWAQQNKDALQRYEGMLASIQTSRNVDFAMLNLALRQLMEWAPPA